MKSRIQKGFTLIELLIVVAIIAILAAIAIPNFLAAQVRAKISRAKGEMASLATAIESYFVDNNTYPFDWDEVTQYPYYLNKGITTPICYISGSGTGIMADPFGLNRRGGLDPISERYRFKNFENNWTQGPPSPFATPDKNAAGTVRGYEVFGGWRLSSRGPDLRVGPLPSNFADGSNATDWLWTVYDPTNGTNSYGDVMRSQKQSSVDGSGYL